MSETTPTKTNAISEIPSPKGFSCGSARPVQNPTGDCYQAGDTTGTPREPDSTKDLSSITSSGQPKNDDSAGQPKSDKITNASDKGVKFTCHTCKRAEKISTDLNARLAMLVTKIFKMYAEKEFVDNDDGEEDEDDDEGIADEDEVDTPDDKVNYTYLYVGKNKMKIELAVMEHLIIFYDAFRQVEERLEEEEKTETEKMM